MLVIKVLPLVAVAWILSVIAIVSGRRSADEINAERFHDRAMKFIEEGNYPLALAHFRAAVRHNNRSVLYWSDLGVTEMRMGLLHKARQRFLQALSVDPTSSLASDNLIEIENYLPPQSVLHNSIAARHRITEVTQLTAMQFVQLLSDSDNSESVLSTPLVVRNAFPAFSIMEERIEAVFNRKFLTTDFGDRIVDFYPHNMVEVQAHPYFLRFDAALRQILHKPEEAYVGVDASQPGTYVQWNLDRESWQELFDVLLGGSLPEWLNDTWWAQPCFPSENSSDDNDISIEAGNSREVYEVSAEGAPESPRRTSFQHTTVSQFMLATHWQMLLLGEAGAGMFNHQDTLRAASWQLQLTGSKKWHLCGPEQSPYLYSAGDVDLFAPDYAKFPLVLNASCTEVTINAGDFLYYPPDYWHQTVNLETPSIALSSTLVNRLGHKGLIEELRNECAGAQRIFVPEEEMCRALESCYAVWEQRYAAPT
jgi:hypothetical protein